MVWREPSIEQTILSAGPPIVYLDHGPMHHLAADAAQAARFGAALRRGGTLALSQANVYEIAAQEDGPSLDALRALLRGVGSRFCVLKTDHFDYAESAARSGGDYIADGFDQGLMQMIDEFDRSRGGLLSDASVIVDWTREWPPEDAKKLSSRAKSGMKWILERARQRYRDANVSPRARPGEPRALECAAALWRVIAQEQSGSVTENDGIDVMHACVPIAACDVVVLDSKWAELTRRVPRQPDGPRRAQVFSGKLREREALLTTLEQHPRMPLSVWDLGDAGCRIGFP
jgi:hypothetical protein